jgi:Mg2+/Co2+ transporter CorB
MDSEPSLLFLFISLLSLLILSAFFSGSETGMMAANKIKLKNLSKKSDRGAKRALKLLKKPDLLLATILVGNNFANILASSIVTIIMLNYFGGNVLLGAVLLTTFILIFSEITPKTMAAVKPESFARRSSILLKPLLYLLRPIIVITNFISSKVLKVFDISVKDAKDNDNLNTQELKTLLDESGDLIPKQYRGMLSSILGMEELVVEDIMTPTSEIIGIDADLGYEENKKIIESSEYTRLPVFRKSIDKELGTLHLKDSHTFLEKIESGQDISCALSKTYFVSQSTALMKQLKEFQDNDKNMALVVDEYGEIEGLITIEDIFKEIAGKFGSDIIELEKEFTQLKDGSVLTDGNSKIRDLNNYLDWSISEENSKTINGLITEYLDQIPQANLCIEIKKYRFEILKIEDNSIARIKIKKIDSKN